MTFQVDVRINRREYINRSVDISVNFDPKNYTKTLDALIDSCKELQPDLTDKEAIEYLTGCLHIQLTEIYKDYEQEQKENKPKKCEERNAKKRYPVYKYSTKDKGNLHEAVSCWVCVIFEPMKKPLLALLSEPSTTPSFVFIPTVVVILCFLFTPPLYGRKEH